MFRLFNVDNEWAHLYTSWKKKISEGTRIVSKKTERCLKGALTWYIFTLNFWEQTFNLPHHFSGTITSWLVIYDNCDFKFCKKCLTVVNWKERSFILAGSIQSDIGMISILTWKSEKKFCCSLSLLLVKICVMQFSL